MSKTREVVCKYYNYAEGPCQKRDIPVSLRKECQTCAKYIPLPGGKPARTDNRKKKLERQLRKEKWDL